jgi:hypothetical protein
MLLVERDAAVPRRLLFTSSRTFPRSRQHVAPLVDALDAWLTKGSPEPPIIEDWLRPV